MSNLTLLPGFEPAQSALDFPVSLTEKYRPGRIADFAGLAIPKAILGTLAKAPRDGGAWLLSGASGTGKTSMALALAAEMPAELHHIPSQNCNLETINSVWARCHYVPMGNFRRHLILIDEADRMTPAAQIALLSKLDSTDPAPDTVVVLTCNVIGGLEPRFLSRCRHIEFSSYGIAAPATQFLEKVWDAETDSDPRKPNFARLVKESNNNIRAALMALELKIMVRDTSTEDEIATLDLAPAIPLAA
jgi:replication-associated recombination protein RarA